LFSLRYSHTIGVCSTSFRFIAIYCINWMLKSRFRYMIVDFGLWHWILIINLSCFENSWVFSHACSHTTRGKFLIKFVYIYGFLRITWIPLTVKNLLIIFLSFRKPGMSILSQNRTLSLCEINLWIDNK